LHGLQSFLSPGGGSTSPTQIVELILEYLRCAYTAQENKQTNKKKLDNNKYKLT